MASTSDVGRQHSFWKQVWSVMIPPKIKNFIWRACTDSLPLRTKLFDRKILNTFSCVLCLEATESCTHLLWDALLLKLFGNKHLSGTHSDYLYIFHSWKLYMWLHRNFTPLTWRYFCGFMDDMELPK